jgi:hypothetical protein
MLRQLNIEPAWNTCRDLSIWIYEQVNGYSFTSSERSRAAFGCFALTQDHNDAVLILCEREMYSSALSLARVVYEACIRGLWLLQCASDTEVSAFLAGKEPPKIKILLSAIEKVPGYTGGEMALAHTQRWSDMCSFTHTGVLQVQRWNTEAAVEPNHDPKEVESLLAFTGGLALISTMGIGSLKNDVALMERVLQKSRGFATAQVAQCGIRGA